ncbi:hypothetical protein U9M48_001562 [Paspalum notatum var. saurae]|uniref:Uncharacterized protein n=1 Tax=Paspalum notatum var. saurae TaxID=547442 RepID=A0AAQ3SIE8_PASNO
MVISQPFPRRMVLDWSRVAANSGVNRQFMQVVDAENGKMLMGGVLVWICEVEVSGKYRFRSRRNLSEEAMKLKAIIFS